MNYDRYYLKCYGPGRWTVVRRDVHGLELRHVEVASCLTQAAAEAAIRLFSL